MRQLIPTFVEDVDVYEAYRPQDPEAPLLRLNMVTSVDGAVTDEHGRSGGLGGSTDRRVFRALRAQADAILVGAGTVRAEAYGPHRVADGLASARQRDGRHAPAAIVVITRSIDLDLTSRLFTAAQTPTVVLTCTAGPASRREAAEAVGPVVVAGHDEVDLAQGLAALRADFGYRHVLAEGGPSVNRQLLGGDLVDELCVTLAPTLIGPQGPRLAGDLDARIELELAALLEDDGELCLRYRVRA